MKDPEVVSDWLSGNVVGKDDGGAPWCETLGLFLIGYTLTLG